MRVLIFSVIIGTALATAVLPYGNRIVGGEDTTIKQYPYMSNMQLNIFVNTWRQWCGGTLITSRTVLSAAHCYEGRPPSQWKVILGSSRSDGTGGSIHPVQEIIMHEDYNVIALDADVAIIKLVIPAIFGETVRIARIPGNVYNLPDNTPVHAIGWGALSSGGPQPEQLQHVQIYTINQDVCAERYDFLRTQPGFESWPRITNGMLCAGVLDVGGRDACQGDSGGPLAHLGDIVIGVTSWGFGCAHDFYPGVNARVSYYSDWIVRHGSV